MLLMKGRKIQMIAVTISNATTWQLRQKHGNGKCPQRYSEDEILQTVSSEKPVPNAQYFSKYDTPNGNAVFVERREIVFV